MPFLILFPRVEKDFAPHAVDTSFVRNKLAKRKLSKATDLDKILARLFKNAASFIAKPVTDLKKIKKDEMWQKAKVLDDKGANCLDSPGDI